MNSPSTPATTARGLPPYILPVAAFVAGAAIMIVEISGNRLIAPVYGNTIYTWTALIGVVLVAMSAGGYLGGRLADNNPRPAVIGGLLVIAGLSTALIPALATVAAGMVAADKMILGPLFLSAVMFLLPGVLLGAVSPYAVKLLSMLRTDHAVGRSAGLISMTGALGSFVGTFTTGFFLLSAFDIRHIITATGTILVLLALPFWLVGRPERVIAKSVMLITLLAAAIGISLGLPESTLPGTVFAKNTYYHFIRVIDTTQAGVKYRLLMLDSTEEGGISLDDDSLPLSYQRYWEILANDKSFHPQRALFVGAGAFGMPRHFAKHWENTTVDVAEIDPEVIAVGRRFFNLDSAPDVHATAADGRSFLRLQPAGSYDFIFGDAYNGVSYIPPHLVTAEFFGIVADKLKPDGVYMMNVIGALRGPASKLTSGVLGGLKMHFPYLAVFTVQRASPELRQNIILMASKQPLDRFLTPQTDATTIGQTLLASKVPPALITPFLAAATPFTDYHNPIDRIIADSLLSNGMHKPEAF